MSNSKIQQFLSLLKIVVGSKNLSIDFQIYHFINCGDDLKHLPPGDEAVLVQVVHAEGPLQLVLKLPSRGDAAGAKKRFCELYTCTQLT